MTIREEKQADFPKIYALVETAFKTAKVSDGTEQDFVNVLRSRSGYIPALALVAEEDGLLVGHIMMTGTVLTREDGRTEEVLLVAPLSVLSEYRSRGIGAALMGEALERARAMGWKAAFLAGDPAYYSRFGFRQSTDFGIDNRNDIPPQYALALELEPGALAGRRGTVEIS